MSHRELQTQAVGVCRRLITTYQVYHYSQRWGTGSRFGIWVRRGCRVFSSPPGRVPKRSPDTRGLLCPAQGAVHQHLKAPGCPGPPPPATRSHPLPRGCAMRVLHAPSAPSPSVNRSPTCKQPTPIPAHSPRRLPWPPPFLPSTSPLSGVASAALE